MLLYDRLMEQTARAGKQLGVRVLEAAVVYEISSVVPLQADWVRERDRPISKRPPCEVVWVEWETAQERQVGKDRYHLGLQLGSLITHVPQDLRDEWWKKLPPKAAASEEAWLCYPFVRLTKADHPAFAGPWQAPRMVDAGIGMFARDDCCDVAEHLVPYNRAHVGSLFDAPLFPAHESGYEAMNACWPAFAAFALLHCKNVVTEDHAPEPRIQRECAKHGRPPRVTYKTLRLEVPASALRRQSYGGDADDGPKVRFHLCSGHFKNLQHERYRSKGWHWWPAHWRGSKELGAVHKDYRLVPKGAP